MSKPLKVLIVEDNQDDALLLVHALRRGGFDPTYLCVDNATALRSALRRDAWDLLICDHILPQFDSFTALQMVEAMGLDLPFIVVSGAVGEEVVVTTMKAGAHDYLMKDNLFRLVPAVKRELEEAEGRRRRRQAEQALRLTQFTVDRSADAAFWVGRDARFFYVNEAACHSLGYTRDELLTMTVHDIDPDFPSAVWPQHWQQLRHRVSRTFESQHRAKDGRVFPVEITVNYLTYDNQEYHCVFARDITERKRLEAQLRQAQKMQAIGTLAGGIAHEFNNVLAVILGYAELTQYMLPQDGAAWQNVQEILAAGRRAKDVVQQILAFSRQTDTARTPTWPHILVQEALRFLRSVLPATIQLETHCEEDVGTILADATQVQQVVMNLCTNAEYAMREISGVLEVRLEAVEVDPALAESSLSLRPGLYIRLTVRDTGRGIDPHIKERIFEPFFTTKAIGEGTGMGLAIVHGIVTSHGGTIMVESVPGQGTTFIVYLPRVEEARNRAELSQESVPQGTESILFVDDEVSLVRLAQQMLHHLGYQVETFTSSGSALAAFRVAPHRFDLAIVDQTMPEMTGEGLTRELRQLRPDLPVILCTGFSHLIDAARAQVLGLDAFLMKPITLGDLAVVIRQVLARRPKHDA